MRIRSHSESHIVELDDGSRWQAFPGDFDLTLGWKPETDLTVIKVQDDIASHALFGSEVKVRVIPIDEAWSARAVQEELKQGGKR